MVFLNSEMCIHTCYNAFNPLAPLKVAHDGPLEDVHQGFIGFKSGKS